MIVKYLLVLLLQLFFLSSAIAQPSIEWQQTFGGSQQDISRSIEATKDGGYIFCASTFSRDADVSENKGSADYWIVKLNHQGLVEWKKTYGGGGLDSPLSIIECDEGGYIVTGGSKSMSGDVVGNHGGEDAWILKLNLDGGIEWQKSIGGTMDDGARSIQQVVDGGFIITGYAKSPDGDLEMNNGEGDFLVAKLSKLGEIEWLQNYGGSGFDWATSIDQTEDLGFIIAGQSFSPDGDVSKNEGGGDYWILKVDHLGKLEWEKSFGGSRGDVARSIIQSVDRGYLVVGSSSSSDGDVAINHGESDYWVLKLSPTGNIEWQKSYGGSNYDQARAIEEVVDGYVIFGYSSSSDGDITKPIGNQDYWLIKIDFQGTLIWDKSFGGSDGDFGEAIDLTSDEGFICTGYSQSSDGDLTSNIGNSDIWIAKLNGCGLNREISVEEDQIEVLFSTDSTSFQWFDCNKGIIIINETRPVFTPLISGNYAVIIQKANCIDTSICVEFCNVSAQIEHLNDTLLSIGNTDDVLYQWLDCGNDSIIDGDNEFVFIPAIDGIYASIVSQGNCADTSECIPIIISSVNETNILRPEVYPNPAINQIHISCPYEIIGSLFMLYDEQGMEVKSNKITSPDTVINISKLDSGVYHLIIQSSTDVFTYRVVKV